MVSYGLQHGLPNQWKIGQLIGGGRSLCILWYHCPVTGSFQCCMGVDRLEFLSGRFHMICSTGRPCCTTLQLSGSWWLSPNCSDSHAGERRLIKFESQRVQVRVASRSSCRFLILPVHTVTNNLAGQILIIFSISHTYRLVGSDLWG